MNVSLTQLIDAYKGYMNATMSGPLARDAEREIRQRRDSNWMKQAAQAGDIVDDIELNVNGTATKLSGLLRAGPLVVKFYRGRWCAFCSLELKAYEHALDQIISAGAQLIAISPEPLNEVRQLSDAAQLSYPVVSDPDLNFARAMRIVYTAGPAEMHLLQRSGMKQQVADKAPHMALPAVFIIDQNRRVSLAHTDPDTSVRADPGLIVKALRRLKHTI